MHTVRRLELDIKLPKGTSRDEAGEVCGELHEKYFRPALEKALGHFDEDGDLIIPSLTIDLGKISPEDIPYRLEQELTAAVRKAGNLLEYDLDVQMGESAVDTPSYLFSEYLSYLETGLLQTRILDRDWTLQEMFDSFMESASMERFSQLASVVERDPAAFFRLLESMPEKFLPEFVLGISGYDAALSGIAQEHGGDKRVLEFMAMIVLLGPGGKVPWSHNLGGFLAGGGDHGKLETFVKDVAMAYRRSGDSGKTSDMIAGLMESLMGGGVYEEESVPEPSDALDLVEPAVMNRIVVDDAGIVLLNPFFHVLFARLGYTDEENNFLSVESRVRAVNVLKGIVSGFEYPHADYNTVLEKIICGLEPSFPLGNDFEATDEEREEVDALFESVTQYWRSMKGASAQALRETFLCRKGTVENDGTGWLLRVEGRSLDILLEDMPWGYSTFVLPWSGQFFVEWQKEY